MHCVAPSAATRDPRRDRESCLHSNAARDTLCKSKLSPLLEAHFFYPYNPSCHNDCAQFSPEVEIADGKWKNVLSAVSRSKTLPCHICGRPGASIGCSQSDCNLSAHYKCGEDTGWRFYKDGKAFFCAKHRREEFDSSRRVSVTYFVSQMGPDLRCVLCGQGEGLNADSMRAYLVPGSVAGSNGSSLVALHSFCAKYSNVAILEDDVSQFLRTKPANQRHHNAALKCTRLGLYERRRRYGGHQDMQHLWIWRCYDVLL